VVVLCAGLWGYLDELPLEALPAFEAGLLEECRQHPEALRALAEVRDVHGPVWRKPLEEIIQSFRDSFLAGRI
jgi:F0F1-type ATP synthase alpha subunit